MKKVKITWNGMGGELDSVTVNDRGGDTLSDALVEMIEGKTVTPDTFTVEEVKS